MHTQESNRLEVARTPVQSSIQKHMTWLDAEMEPLKKQIKDHINQAPDLKTKSELLESIPGIGERTSSMFLAFYPIHRQSRHDFID